MRIPGEDVPLAVGLCLTEGDLMTWQALAIVATCRSIE